MEHLETKTRNPFDSFVFVSYNKQYNISIVLFPQIYVKYVLKCFAIII